MSKSAAHKLRVAVAAAYEEGFLDGASHGNLTYKYPPQRVAWLRSNTRRDHYPPRTPEQAGEVLAWENANYDGREKAAEMMLPEGLPL